jgi:DNA polymerase-4
MSSASAEPAAADDGGCPILHVDMDAFYASVELRDRPELAGQPVIVGATSSRGVVLSATYEARAFGVHSAMPVTRARRLCPQAIFIPPRHGSYTAVSREVMEVFRSVTPEVEPLALDEAFLDVSGAIRRLGRPAQIGELIRATIAEQQGITCSVGVASCKFVAKLASARCKPDGLLVVPADGVLDFLHPLPVAALWGVGERTGQVLARLGLRTVGDIAQIPVATLQRELGQAAGAHLAALAWGRDERPVVSRVPEKSIGAEETFPSDVDDPDVIRRELLRLSGRTARGLRSAGALARTVVVKLRLANFTTITRSRTLPEPTDVAQTIYATACELYSASGLDSRARLRLVGVRANGLVPASRAATQLAFGQRAAGWRDAERALDQISGRFGADSVRPAALVTGQRPGPPPRPPPRPPDES